MRPHIPLEAVIDNLLIAVERVPQYYVESYKGDVDETIRNRMAREMSEHIAEKLEPKRVPEKEDEMLRLQGDKYQVHEAQLVIFTRDELYKFVDKVFEANGINILREEDTSSYPVPVIHFPPEKAKGEWE